MAVTTGSPDRPPGADLRERPPPPEAPKGSPEKWGSGCHAGGLSGRGRGARRVGFSAVGGLGGGIPSVGHGGWGSREGGGWGGWEGFPGVGVSGGRGSRGLADSVGGILGDRGAEGGVRGGADRGGPRGAEVAEGWVPGSGCAKFPGSGGRGGRGSRVRGAEGGVPRGGWAREAGSSGVGEGGVLGAARRCAPWGGEVAESPGGARARTAGSSEVWGRAGFPAVSARRVIPRAVRRGVPESAGAGAGLGGRKGSALGGGVEGRGSRLRGRRGAGRGTGRGSGGQAGHGVDGGGDRGLALGGHEREPASGRPGAEALHLLLVAEPHGQEDHAGQGKDPGEVRARVGAAAARAAGRDHRPVPGGAGRPRAPRPGGLGGLRGPGALPRPARAHGPEGGALRGRGRCGRGRQLSHLSAPRRDPGGPCPRQVASAGRGGRGWEAGGAGMAVGGRGVKAPPPRGAPEGV